MRSATSPRRRKLKPKTVFFGTSEFAVPSLRASVERANVVAVVTQPDRPAGRGHKLRPSPVKAAAIELGVPVLEPLAPATLVDEPSFQNLDLIALASYGRILPAPLLALPRAGALNVHPSLLPKYRGATPIQTAIRNGDSETGVTIMLMDAGMDTGDVVFQERVAIAPGETYGELHDRLARIGAELLARAIDAVASGSYERHPQHGETSITKPLRNEDLDLDWSWDARRFVDVVRSLSPAPAARAVVDGERVKVLRAHEGDDGSVVIDELIAPNRGKMRWDAYVRSRAARRSP
jgi:methionyl-tRNA formyltransferase